MVESRHTAPAPAAPAAPPLITGTEAFCLEESAVRQFIDASHDRNPLHDDANYARRTPFGRCIAHGMLGVLGALRVILSAGPLRLRTLRCTFAEPLYPGMAYDLEWEQQNGSATMRVSRGGVRKLEVKATYHRGGPFAIWMGAASPAPTRVPDAPDPTTLQGANRAGRYRVAGPALTELCAALRLPAGGLPAAQLQALAWVSYFCGMEVPGRQSLIASVDMRFDEGERPAGALEYAVSVERSDPRFRRLDLRATLSVDGAVEATVSIGAFSRPEATVFSLSEVATHVGRSERLAGKVGLVTGASRGLGADLAATLALHGCIVGMNYRSGRVDAERVRTAIAADRGLADLVPGDLDRLESIATLRAWATRRGALDFLILNAAPAILPASLGEMDAAEVAEFVRRSVEPALRLTQALLPLMESRGGTVVAISSSYVTKPPRRFLHYVAAKRALEGVMEGLAAERPTVRFLVLRAPRLITDQTNVAFDLQPRLAPALVGERLLRELSETHTPGVVRVVNFADDPILSVKAV